MSIQEHDITDKATVTEIESAMNETVDSIETQQRVCLLAVDGSQYSDSALKWYKDNVYKETDKTLVVHCVDHRKHLTYGTVAMIPGNPDSITQAYHEEERKGTEILQKYKTECVQHGLKNVELIKVRGGPGHGILQAATEMKADLIVTGCRGLGQIRRTILGSVSSYILHHSEVPVFICRH